MTREKEHTKTDFTERIDQLKEEMKISHQSMNKK